VNVMLMSPYVEEVIEVVLAQGVPIVALGGSNLPLAYVSRFKEAGLKVMPVVSTVALAKRVERLGADVIVAEGMESGGHIGEATTMVLVPQVIDAVSVPVVAAGGFCDGRGLVAALALGAQGVQLGTRFICSEECIAHTEFKERILRSGDMATAVTGKALGHPVRALRNKLTREFLAKERAGVSKEELEQLGMGKLHLGVIEGDVDNGSLMAGQVVGLVKEIKPVAEIIEGIITEAEAIIDRLSGIPYREKSWTRSL
jgi:enoyl-[acyl-carrier protein] reductase II